MCSRFTTALARLVGMRVDYSRVGASDDDRDDDRGDDTHIETGRRRIVQHPSSSDRKQKQITTDTTVSADGYTEHEVILLRSLHEKLNLLEQMRMEKHAWIGHLLEIASNIAKRRMSGDCRTNDTATTRKLQNVAMRIVDLGKLVNVADGLIEKINERISRTGNASFVRTLQNCAREVAGATQRANDADEKEDVTTGDDLIEAVAEATQELSSSGPVLDDVFDTAIASASVSTDNIVTMRTPGNIAANLRKLVESDGMFSGVASGSNMGGFDIMSLVHAIDNGGDGGVSVLDTHRVNVQQQTTRRHLATGQSVIVDPPKAQTTVPSIRDSVDDSPSVVIDMATL